jgi:hypothetical protein
MLHRLVDVIDLVPGDPTLVVAVVLFPTTHDLRANSRNARLHMLLARCSQSVLLIMLVLSSIPLTAH